MPQLVKNMKINSKFKRFRLGPVATETKSLFKMIPELVYWLRDYFFFGWRVRRVIYLKLGGQWDGAWTEVVVRGMVLNNLVWYDIVQYIHLFVLLLLQLVVYKPLSRPNSRHNPNIILSTQKNSPAWTNDKPLIISIKIRDLSLRQTLPLDPLLFNFSSYHGKMLMRRRICRSVDGKGVSCWGDVRSCVLSEASLAIYLDIFGILGGFGL